MNIKIKRVREVPLPGYQTDGAAGVDLHAALDAPIVLQSRCRVVVPTGLKLEIPRGVEAQVRPRSGLAANKGITVLNTPGTIDSDFRGEVQVILINLGNLPQTISNLDRIAQIVFAPVLQVNLLEETLEQLSLTDRGEGGFGSTGEQ